MSKETNIKLFESKQVRTLWNETEEEWYFSVVDVVGVLTEQLTQDGARNYWKVLKKRLIEEGNEPVTNCNQLKLPAQDGKMRLTDVASTEQIFRIIQSIPSPKAEPFKQWLAHIAKERIDQLQYPELCHLVLRTSLRRSINHPDRLCLPPLRRRGIWITPCIKSFILFLSPKGEGKGWRILLYEVINIKLLRSFYNLSSQKSPTEHNLIPLFVK